MPILTPTSLFKKDIADPRQPDVGEIVVKSGFLSPTGKAPKASKDVNQGSYWHCNKAAVQHYQNGEYKDCIAQITEAKRLVDQNPNKVANAQNKSIVYYNYSQFVSAIYPCSSRAKQEALEYIDKALAMYSSDNDYRQDCLVHKAYVFFSQKKISDAQNTYKMALEINPSRFISDLTTDGTGKELFFWSIDYDSFVTADGSTWNWLDKLSEMQILKYGHITPNVASNGLGVLLVAVMNNKLGVIDKLLALGANPCYREDKAISKSALAYALKHEDWSLSKKFIEHMKMHPEFLITEEVKILLSDIPEEDRIVIDSSNYMNGNIFSISDSKISGAIEEQQFVSELERLTVNKPVEEDQVSLVGVLALPHDGEV